MELVSNAAFIFRNPSASLDDTKEFLDTVSKNFKRAKELNFSTISMFTLDSPFQIQLGTSSIGDIIGLALQFKVEELNLILTNEDLNFDSSKTFELFQLPADFFNENTFLKNMNLAMCSFSEIRETIKWDSLTQLKLAHTCLDKIDKIAEGCPVLKELRLCECWGCSYLDFDNHKTLSLLMLDGVWSKSEEKVKYITISAPTIRDLVLTGDFNSRHVYFRDISACLRATIGFHLTSGDHLEKVGKYGFDVLALRVMLSGLQSVWHLTFGTWFIEICSNGICIHDDISKRTNEISPLASSSSDFYNMSRGFDTLKFSNPEAAANHVGDLPIFVENLIKNSRYLKKVILA